METDLNSQYARWRAFHSRLIEWFGANPHRYKELLHEMSQTGGLEKYQNSKGVAALKKSISRVKDGQGALREPIVLEFLLKELAWDPRELFGTTPPSTSRLDATVLARDVANHVLGELRKEWRSKNPPDNLPGGPKKKLLVLIPIVQTIIGFARSFHPSGSAVLASVHTWITPNWHRVVKKDDAILGADEKVWLNVMTPERQLSPVALEGLGLLLVLVYAVHVHRQILGALMKLGSAKATGESIEVSFDLAEASPEEDAKLSIELVEALVDRIVATPGPISPHERSALHQALLQICVCLERLAWWSWKVDAVPVNDQVSSAKSWLRHILLREKFEMFRLVRKLTLDENYSGSSKRALQILQVCRDGNPDAIRAVISDQSVVESKPKSSPIQSTFDPLIYGSTIQKLIDRGILAVPDGSTWVPEINRIIGQQNSDINAFSWSTMGKGLPVPSPFGFPVFWRLPQ